MTTIIATRTEIYADTKCNYTVPFRTPKLERIGDCIYGGTGDMIDILKFYAWVQVGGDKPEFGKNADFDVLEVSKSGIRMWDKQLTPMVVREKIYAIGSGSHYATGALAMGADPLQALKIAAKYDPNTGAPFDRMEL